MLWKSFVAITSVFVCVWFLCSTDALSTVLLFSTSPKSPQQATTSCTILKKPATVWKSQNVKEAAVDQLGVALAHGKLARRSEQQ